MATTSASSSSTSPRLRQPSGDSGGGGIGRSILIGIDTKMHNHEDNNGFHQYGVTTDSPPAPNSSGDAEPLKDATAASNVVVADDDDDVMIVNNQSVQDATKKNGTDSVDCIMLDDEEEEEAGLAVDNGGTDAIAQNGTDAHASVNASNNDVDDDDDDDDDVRLIEEPVPKRARRSSNDDNDDAVVVVAAGDVPMGAQPPPVTRSPVPEDPKTSTEPTMVDSTAANGGSKLSTSPNAAGGAALVPSPDINTYGDLLDRLQLYVRTSINGNDAVDRKVLDALLSAINTQVQKAPYAVRKLILDKQLVLPNTISVPPSQIVELLIEHDPDHQLSRVVNRMFGEERPKLTEHEKKEKQLLKAMHPAPSMTKLLLDIGQDMVQESTYFDIVHARNLPEMPKNMDTYKQVAAQLRPVWEGLKAKNEPYKLKMSTCHVCNFKTDSRTVLDGHMQTLHFIGRRYQCTFCPEFDTNEFRITKHIIEEHGVRPAPAETMSTKMQCPICEVDFNYKGQRDSHLRVCRRDLHKLRTIQSGHSPEHILMVNRWLWEKPPVEPSILIQQQQQQQQQQQDAFRQQQQQFKQQQLLLRNQRLLGGSGTTTTAANSSLTALAAQQARLLGGALSNRFPTTTSANASAPQQVGPSVGQILRMAREKGQNITPQMIQAAMQTQLLQQQQKMKSHQILAAAAAKLPHHQTAPGATTTMASNQQQRAAVVQNARQQLLKTSAAAVAHSSSSSSAPPMAAAAGGGVGPNSHVCEICDFAQLTNREQYRMHLQSAHRQLLGKGNAEMASGAPLACSRCRDRFWTYEGLERHLVMVHGLVTGDLLAKAQRKADAGRCKLCSKQYAFNILQHLVTDHQIKLCSAEIMYSCDVCSYRCTSYQKLERHLETEHPNTANKR